MKTSNEKILIDRSHYLWSKERYLCQQNKQSRSDPWKFSLMTIFIMTPVWSALKGRFPTPDKKVRNRTSEASVVRRGRNVRYERRLCLWTSPSHPSANNLDRTHVLFVSETRSLRKVSSKWIVEIFLTIDISAVDNAVEYLSSLWRRYSLHISKFQCVLSCSKFSKYYYKA